MDICPSNPNGHKHHWIDTAHLSTGKLHQACVLCRTSRSVTLFPSPETMAQALKATHGLRRSVGWL